MVKIKQIKTCPYCMKVFTPRTDRIKFCCYEHAKRHQQLRTRTKNELFKLTEEELIVWKRIHEVK